MKPTELRLKSPALAGQISPNLEAFLQTLAFAEIGPKMLRDSRNGYDILVGSLPGRLNLFESFSDHPMRGKKPLEYSKGVFSTASGRYQILFRYWDHYQKQLGLPDFGPASQDRYAIQQIREQRALGLIEDGKFFDALAACRNIWASLPGAGYDQHEYKAEILAGVYCENGGRFGPQESVDSSVPPKEDQHALHWYAEIDWDILSLDGFTPHAMEPTNEL